jgi:hypothetical protein
MQLFSVLFFFSFCFVLMADRIGRVENAYLCHNGYRFFFGFLHFLFLKFRQFSP